MANPLCVLEIFHALYSFLTLSSNFMNFKFLSAPCNCLILPDLFLHFSFPGFFHEQARNDRDSFVEVNWENILDGELVALRLTDVCKVWYYYLRKSVFSMRMSTYQWEIHNSYAPCKIAYESHEKKVFFTWSPLKPTKNSKNLINDLSLVGSQSDCCGGKMNNLKPSAGLRKHSN